MTLTPHQDSFKKMKKSISPELKNLLVSIRVQKCTRIG